MDNRFLLFYIIFFVCALVFSLVVNAILLKFSRNLGVRNATEPIIRWSSTSKPALGGISFFIVFLLAVIATNFSLGENQFFFNIKFIGIVISVTLGFLLGLFDDAYNTKPLLKFLSQLSCGAILIVSGTSIQFFGYWLPDYLLTIFWVVGIMNSVNMLDNMDGITSVVSLSIFLGVLAQFIFGVSDPLLMTVIIIGGIASILGFLVYNWNPSRMYMGDTGSQFLGVLLAVLGIIFYWNHPSEATGIQSSSLRLLSVVMAFALPIIDTTTVSIKRIRKGSSPFVGGRDHTTHHLNYIGLSDRKVAVLFLTLSLLSNIAAFFIVVFGKSMPLTIGISSLIFFLALFFSLFYIANKNLDRN